MLRRGAIVPIGRISRQINYVFDVGDLLQPYIIRPYEGVRDGDAHLLHRRAAVYLGK